ncbi:predicted protein [Plenodomus lingam JN3]|uniref:Predicted protein n=1 Tax=Leptosphaeria maculans (strain JN3 / isolate v23.1.3 / race Av1-4-5-6-7-8) TaxID=985895 RepID=E5AEC6_LEPMJ|nr:predicted protein [Plenodomus lingam JN3]CBY01565.1 predicted protein [Plenodomus lingam JN3]
MKVPRLVFPCLPIWLANGAFPTMFDWPWGPEKRSRKRTYLFSPAGPSDELGLNLDSCPAIVTYYVLIW